MLLHARGSNSTHSVSILRGLDWGEQGASPVLTGVKLRSDYLKSAQVGGVF
jgi:hypothetical protein